MAFLFLPLPSFALALRLIPIIWSLEKRCHTNWISARGVNVARVSEIVRNTGKHLYIYMYSITNAFRYKMRHALLNTPVFSSRLNRFRILISRSWSSHSPCKKHREIYIYIYTRLSKKRKMQMCGTKDLRMVMENLDNAERESDSRHFHVITFSVGSLFRVHM